MTATNKTSDIVNILLVDDDPAEHILLRRKLEAVKGSEVALDYVATIAAAVERASAGGIDLVLLDNRLAPDIDFRDTAPQLRKAGYVGPIGLISSDISEGYVQRFEEFGVDFRIGKDEIDGAALSFILSEYGRDPSADIDADDFS